LLRYAINKAKQELDDQIESKVKVSRYETFSEHITESIQLRLRALAEKNTSEHLEHMNIIGDETYICADSPHSNVFAVKYEDGSAWVMCPMFGWYDDNSLKCVMKLGCIKKKTRCSWFTQNR